MKKLIILSFFILFGINSYSQQQKRKVVITGIDLKANTEWYAKKFVDNIKSTIDSVSNEQHKNLYEALLEHYSTPSNLIFAGIRKLSDEQLEERYQIQLKRDSIVGSILTEKQMAKFIELEKDKKDILSDYIKRRNKTKNKP